MALPCSCVEIWGLKDIDERLEKLRLLFDRGFSCPDEMLLDEEQVKELTYKKLEYPERLENRMIRALREGSGKMVKETGQEFIRTVIWEMVRRLVLRNIPSGLPRES